jgi:short-subunit dehydrogenase involved in D-alanine esterification of teichoic acids
LKPGSACSIYPHLQKLTVIDELGRLEALVHNAAVTQAMLPLLREASAVRIVNVSSSSGSLTMNTDPTNPHRSM